MAQTWNYLVEWLTLAVMLFGLLGLIIPILPGLLIIWAAALGYGLYAGFGVSGWVVFALQTVLMLAGSFVDNFLMGGRAYREGAAWWSILLALGAAVVGQFVIPVPIIGGVLLAIAVLFLVEWARRRDWRASWRAVRGLLSGCGWSVVIRVAMGAVMIGLWMIWAWA
jgi:uncharacterized protein YqgC (DUF456 family)